MLITMLKLMQTIAVEFAISGELYHKITGLLQIIIRIFEKDCFFDIVYTIMRSMVQENK